MRNERIPGGSSLASGRRIWGVIMLVPGVVILIIGGYLLNTMIESGLYSIQALLCAGLFGFGLTGGGLVSLLGGSADS